MSKVLNLLIFLSKIYFLYYIYWVYIIYIGWNLHFTQYFESLCWLCFKIFGSVQHFATCPPLMRWLTFYVKMRLVQWISIQHFCFDYSSSPNAYFPRKSACTSAAWWRTKRGEQKQSKDREESMSQQNLSYESQYSCSYKAYRMNGRLALSLSLCRPTMLHLIWRYMVQHNNTNASRHAQSAVGS